MKQKRAAKTINPPSSNEINSSKLCQQLQLSFENFQQSKSDEKFNSFINAFTAFLDKETNMKLLTYFSPLMITNIINHISSIEFDSILCNQVFSLINLIIPKMNIIFSASSITTFFLFISNNYEKEGLKILTDNKKTITNIFSDENFFYDFINSNNFILTFQTLFLQISSNEICSLYNQLIFSESPIDLLINYDFQPILDCLQQTKPKESLYPETAIFITHSFSLSTKYQNYFNNKDHFEYLTSLLNLCSFDTIIMCFQSLIFTDPPNFDLFKNIVSFYQNNSKIQDQFFVWIFEFVKSNSNIVSHVNSIVPFANWVTPKTPVSRLLNAMKLMNSIHPSLVSQFLSLYFSILCKEESDINSYLCGIGIVESQIFHRRISLSFLLNSLFLNAFIVKPSIDKLNEIFLKSYTFPQLVYDIYALPDAKPIRKEVLAKIIQVSLKNKELTSIVSAFLVISDSCENLREMMNLIENEKSGHLCDSFCSAFPKSKTLTNNFLQEYGMKWIFSAFDKQIIDLEMVKNLILGLTSREGIQNIDDFLESLPKDHPLFSLKADDIRSIIYGVEDPPVFFPIRVYSLFHIIPCPWSIDPYNAFIIGKNVLKKYDDIFNLPIISEIGNRYITSDIFYQFLKKPTQLEDFADSSYDHFPIFQIFEYTNEKIFDISFRSISFWFKFASKIDDSLKIPFFHTSKFNLFLKQNILIANYEGTEYEVPINPLNWNHIFITISPSLISHKIKIWVNLSKAIFTSPTKVNDLSNFGFLVYASYLYLAPAIRIYQNKCSEYTKIFELGPSSMKKLNEDILITPFSSIIPSDKNILSVPYNGFPAHFRSQAKLNYFFEIMKKTENDDDFDKLLSLFYKVYLILRYTYHELISSLLTFFASIPNRLTKDRFINILTFFGNHTNKKSLINEILKNQLFWNNVSNDIIIFSLVSYFKTFDFYDDIDSFQFFLSQKMISNPNSKYIMTSFLVNSNALPKCHKCLLALFLCHHFMVRRENKEIQCSINVNNQIIKEQNRKNVQKDETNQYFLLIDKKNVSVQCQMEITDNNQLFDEQLLLFNDVQNTELQFTLIDCFYDFIQKSGNADSIKLILPMEDLLSLFIVSQNNFKASLFKIFVLIEQMSPGFIVIDNLFLTAFFPLFIYQSVWDETMKLITSDGKLISNSSISLILALIWSFTAASLYSVAQTGKSLSINFEKEIKFCSLNSSIISSNKTAQHFIRIWYPLLLGYSTDRNNSPLPSFRLESVEIIPPKVQDFSNHIWKTVIQSAREIDNDLPLKTDEFYQKEFKDFVSKSELILFLSNVILSTPENQFNNIFAPFLLIPLISKTNISEVFICEFTTNCLTYLSQTFTLEMPFNSFVTVLHYLSNSGLLKSNFQFILSDIFVIISMISSLHNKYYKKVSTTLNNLLIDLFSNCDSESFHLLFNILQQHVLIFIELIKMTNSLDLYLSFFQKVSHNCYKEFDTFFKKFLNFAEINQKNKRIEDLLNHVEISNNSQMNKWNKTVNSLNSISKPIKYEINECHQSMMMELTENVKEFSLTYFISRKRQHNFCDSLTKLFESYEKIQLPEDSYQNSIKLIQESSTNSITMNFKDKINPNDKRLFPFSFPLALPRLFVPIPIKSSKDVFKFISDHKLYSTKVSSFDQFERISLSSNNSKQKSKKRSLSPASSSANLMPPTNLSNLSSSPSSHELSMKRSNSLRSISSQPIPKNDELNKKRNQHIQSQKSEQQIQINSVFQYSNTNSSFMSYPSSSLQLKPIIFNCQLLRFNYSIPTVASISANNLRLIPFCKYESNMNSNSSLLTLSNSDSNFESDSIDFTSSSPSGNFSLDPEFVAKFVMEVINGFWGDTQLFEKRIVIKIPLNTILFISKKSDKSFAFWTQKSGTFILNNVENDVFTKIPFSEMNPLSSINRFVDKNEVVKKWIEGSLSASQMIVALNISEGRDYVDLRNFIKLPDSFTIFGTFSPINESLAANLTEGLMIGKEEYTNSIELSENDASIINYIKKFGIQNESTERQNKEKEMFSINDTISCQKISGTVPLRSLFDDKSIVTDLPLLSAKVSLDFPIYIIVDQSDLSIYLYDYDAKEKIYVLYSEDFCVAKSLSVSQNFMFFSVDFVNNLSCVYRIVFELGLPAMIEPIRESSFLNDQKTAVNGSELMAATFSEKTIYLWPFYRHSYHRIINCEEEIRFCQFDDNAGTFWACGVFSCFLFDLNGQLFSSYKFEKEISAFCVVNQPISECDRSIICGFDDGSVALVSPKIKTAELFVKELNKVHQSKVIKIVFHPKNNYFMTIDNCQNAYLWTKRNIDEIANEISISLIKSNSSW